MIFGLLLNEFDSKLLTSSFNYFYSYLDISEIDIPIELTLVDNIGKGKTAGTCSPKYGKDLKLEKIEIKVKQNVTVFGMIEALAHEMVHAKQFIKGDVTVEFKKEYLWGFLPMYKVVRKWKGEDVTDLTYYNQPAEREAHLLQREMTLQFLNANKTSLTGDYMKQVFELATESINN